MGALRAPSPPAGDRDQQTISPHYCSSACTLQGPAAPATNILRSSSNTPYIEQRHVNPAPYHDIHLQQTSNDITEPSCKKKYSRCMKFFSTSGCPYGEQCHFQHFASPGMSKLASTIMASLPGLKGAKKRALVANLLDPSFNVKGYKTKLCYNYLSNSAQGCKYGEHCHFAHTEAELRAKTSPTQWSKVHWHSHHVQPDDQFLLSSLNTCRILIPCHAPMPSSSNPTSFHCKHMKHSAPMDNLSSSLYYGEPIPPGVSISSCTEASAEDCNSCERTRAGSSPSSVLNMEPCNDQGDELCNRVVATSMSIDAEMVGFIIGKAGSNVRHISKLTGSKLSIREHSPKVRIVHMEGLPYQVDGAQQMINLLLEAREGCQRKSL